jgi:hypothetical protein
MLPLTAAAETFEQKRNNLVRTSGAEDKSWCSVLVAEATEHFFSALQDEASNMPDAHDYAPSEREPSVDSADQSYNFEDVDNDTQSSVLSRELPSEEVVPQIEQFSNTVSHEVLHDADITSAPRTTPSKSKRARSPVILDVQSLKGKTVEVRVDGETKKGKVIGGGQKKIAVLIENGTFSERRYVPHDHVLL